MGGMQRVGLVLALLVLSCAAPERKLLVPDEPEPTRDPFAGEDLHVDLEKANGFIAKAEQALLKNDFKSAEKYLQQAEPFGNDSTQESLRRFRQKMAHIQAMRLAKPLAVQVKAGKCMQVADAVAAQFAKGKRPMVGVLLRKELSAKLLDCLLGALQIDVSIGREYSESSSLRNALVKLDYQRLQSGVDDATAARVVARLQKLIDRKSWSKVLAALDELVARKEAGSKEVRGVMRVVQTAIAKQVEEIVAQALTASFGAAARLREVDRLLRQGRFSKAQTLQAGLAENVRTQRETLALVVECQRLACKWVSPRKVYALGAAAVHPVLDASAPALAKAKHASTVWLLAEGRKSWLVAKTKPSTSHDPRDAVKEAWGWVAKKRLFATDTSTVLPPDETVIGQPVWGKLRSGQSLWELGRVAGLVGTKLRIQRASDHRMVTLARSQVRFGKTEVGMQVMVDCGKLGTLQQGVIQAIARPKRGEPTFQVRCNEGPKKGATRRILYGALRSRAEDVR